MVLTVTSTQPMGNVHSVNPCLLDLVGTLEIVGMDCTLAKCGYLISYLNVLRKFWSVSKGQIDLAKGRVTCTKVESAE